MKKNKNFIYLGIGVVLIVVVVIIFACSGNKKKEEIGDKKGTSDKFTYEVKVDENDKKVRLFVNNIYFDKEATDINVIGLVNKKYLLVRYDNYTYHDYVLVNEKSELVKLFTTNSAFSSVETTSMLKGMDTADIKIDGNSILIGSVNFFDNKGLCELKDDEDAYYQEKVTVSNDKISNFELVKTISAKDYKTNNNIICE